MSRPILKLLAIALLAGVTSPATAQSNQAQVGMLTCKTSANLGLIIGSRSGGAPDYYTGTIGRLGLDIGVTAGGVLGWAVFAPSTGVPRGALAGKYGGASGEVSVGVGVGANALFGGSTRSIALQPVSVEGQIGANFALGVAALTLYGL
ncbi:MAG: DUF992 domain-containing protein [Pseudolabrys sp.]